MSELLEIVKKTAQVFKTTEFNCIREAFFVKSELDRLEINSQLVAGSVAWRVGSNPLSIVAFGLVKARLEEGSFIGHVWVESNGKIIDTTVRNLPTPSTGKEWEFDPILDPTTTVLDDIRTSTSKCYCYGKDSKLTNQINSLYSTHRRA